MPRPKAKDGTTPVELRFRVPRALYDSLTLYCALTGEHRVEWCRRNLLAAVEAGLARFPVRYCWLRPGATIYSLAHGVYSPIARAAGGERAWPIEVVELPSVLSGSRQGWMVDITAERGGFEARGVYVSLESVVGIRPGPPPVRTL